MQLRDLSNDCVRGSKISLLGAVLIAVRGETNAAAASRSDTSRDLIKSTDQVRALSKVFSAECAYPPLRIEPNGHSNPLVGDRDGTALVVGSGLECQIATKGGPCPSPVCIHLLVGDGFKLSVLGIPESAGRLAKHGSRRSLRVAVPDVGQHCTPAVASACAQPNG